MHKKERQNALIALIETITVTSQGDLACRLKEYGFGVTQTSVSRDLNELGIVKHDGRYILPPKQSAANDFGLIKFDAAGENLIVGRCSSGLASAITVKIDAANITEIVGTIAGDDTIFIAVQNAESQTAAFRKIVDLFG